MGNILIIKKLGFVLFLFFVVTLLKGQVFEIKYLSPLSFPNNTVDKQNMFYQASTLYATKKTSLFLIHAQEKNNFFDDKNMEASFNFGHEDMWFHKDISSNKLISYQPVLGEKYYIVEDSLTTIKWKIYKESKIIGTLKCNKATTSFRGRSYEVWFTTEIPLSNGPWKLGGLPGLILEAYDEAKEVVFLFKGIKKTAHMPNLPNNIKGEKISPQDYYSIGLTEFKKYFKYAEAKMNKTGADIQISIDSYSPWEIFK